MRVEWKGRGLLRLTRKPVYRVVQHPERLRLQIHGEGLVTGSEVKDAAFSDLPHAAAAKMLTLIPPLLKDDGIWLRHMKRLVVHFGVRHIPLCRQTGCDRVLRQQR